MRKMIKNLNVTNSITDTQILDGINNPYCETTWFNGSAMKQTCWLSVSIVAQLNPNGFGLYDLHGNM